MKRLLIVDDEPNIRRTLQVAFEKDRYEVASAESAEAALAILKAEAFDVLLTDVTMPGMTGFDLLRDARALHPDLRVVIMTAFGTIPQAVQAMRDGAFEFVTKPFDLTHLRKIVKAAADGGEGGSRGAVPARGKGKSRFIAESPAMKAVLATIDQVAASRATVMIGGESGVGKEVVARALHERSSRADGPFVAVSCAALPESLLESELFGYEKGAFTGAQNARVGRFEAASGGTLFLDEVGEIAPSVQVKLLRVLQEREIERLGANRPTKIDVRVVTATHRDLHAAVERGIFRLDLLYRLQVVELVIPPLRERTEDILPLATHFLAKFAEENDRAPLEIGRDAEAALIRHAWPGNVRELENAMERATVLARPDETTLPLRLLPSPAARAA